MWLNWMSDWRLDIFQFDIWSQLIPIWRLQKRTWRFDIWSSSICSTITRESCRSQMLVRLLCHWEGGRWNSVIVRVCNTWLAGLVGHVFFLLRCTAMVVWKNNHIMFLQGWGKWGRILIFFGSTWCNPLVILGLKWCVSGCPPSQ